MTAWSLGDKLLGSETWWIDPDMSRCGCRSTPRTDWSIIQSQEADVLNVSEASLWQEPGIWDGRGMFE